MLKQRRDLIILLGLFVILVVFTILGPGRSQDESWGSRPTTHSSRAGGAMALLRWTRSLGYDARQLQYTEFALDHQPGALFILNPSVTIDPAEAEIVLEWVEQGGTLILADDRAPFFRAANTLLRELQLQIQLYDGEGGADAVGGRIDQAPILQPVFHTPPVPRITARTTQVVVADNDQAVTLIGLSDGAVLVGLKRGQGYVYVSSAIFPFTNLGLREQHNADLILNLLRRVPPGGQILFDEYHHGFFTPPSLRSIIFSNPWGWALLYALAVMVAYLILTGRRFGRPIPLREEVALRSTTEYVESMADLFQRSGKRAFVLRHYYTSFKRRLARPYGLSPDLDDAVFVSELAHYADIDQPALQTLLNRLRRERVSEDALVRMVVEADSMAVKREQR